MSKELENKFKEVNDARLKDKEEMDKKFKDIDNKFVDKPDADFIGSLEKGDGSEEHNFWKKTIEDIESQVK